MEGQMKVRFFDGTTAQSPPGGEAELLISIAFDEVPGVDQGQMRETVRPATMADTQEYGQAFVDYSAAGGKKQPADMPAEPEGRRAAPPPPGEHAPRGEDRAPARPSRS
jgi:hypothetical protein